MFATNLNESIEHSIWKRRFLRSKNKIVYGFTMKTQIIIESFSVGPQRNQYYASKWTLKIRSLPILFWGVYI